MRSLFSLVLFFAAASIYSLAWAQINIPSINVPYDDADFSCTPEAQAKQYVQDFRINTQSFGGLELCNAKVDTKKLFNDLEIIEKGKFSADANHKLIRGFIPKDQYYSWMKSQTRGIKRGNDIPYATAYNSGGYFTMQNGWAVLSTLGRVGTVIHEARHTAGYVHEICPAGPYKNTTVSGCDDRFSSGGSHAVEMEYYARVATQGENFHPVYKAMARLMAMGRSNFVFSESPIKTRQALVTITSDHRTYVHDGANSFERRTPLAEGVLKRTSFGASIFDTMGAFAIELYENFSSPKDLEDIYSYFKLLGQDRGQGKSIQDFEEFDYGAKRYVLVMNEDNQITKYNFQAGKFNNYGASVSPAKETSSFVTTSPDGKENLYVKTETNEVYSIDPENLNNIQKAGFSWPVTIKNYAKANSHLWSLNADKEVLKFENGIWTAVPEMGSVEQMVAAPLYDAFEVIKE